MNLTLLLTAIGGYLAVILKEIPMRLINILVNIKSVTFTVISKDREVYKVTNDWLFKLNNKQLQNHVNGSQIKDEYYNKTTQMSIDYGTYFIKLKGLNFMTINKKLIENNYDAYDSLSLRIIGFNKIKYKEGLISKIESNCSNKDKIRIYPCNNIWDNYTSPKKSFDSIICTKKQEILDFINNWLKIKEVYTDKGIIYKTGILLYGKSGTGKTSICRAVASYLGFNLHIINLKAYEKAQDLINRMVDVPPNSMILFEDIDCVLRNDFDEGSNEDGKRKELLEIVLNILDGAMSPNNCIFFATTNHFELLDEALIRDGRFDLKLEIEYFNEKEAKEMCDMFKVEYDILENETYPLKPAYLQQKILRNILKYREENDYNE